MRCSLRIFAVALGLALAPRLAAAQSQELPGAYVAVKGSLGFLGSLNVQSDAKTLESNAKMPIDLAAVDEQSDLLSAAFGFDVSYVFGVHRFFGIAPLFGIHGWHSEEAEKHGEGASIVAEVGASLQPRIPLGSRFELYASFPLSLTLSFLNEYKTWTELQQTDAMMLPKGTAKDVDPSYGYGLGAYVGARYAITGRFGVLTELGYQRYAFTHGVEFQISPDLDVTGIGTTLDLACVVQQFRWNIGVFF